MSLPETIFIPPDPNVKYSPGSLRKSKGFTLLMKLVILTREFPDLDCYLVSYCKQNPEEVNKKNDKGLTALMLAAANSTTLSREKTVDILIAADADHDIRCHDECTALIYAVRYHAISRSETTIKMLIEAKADISVCSLTSGTALIEASDCCVRENSTISSLVTAAKKSNKYPDNTRLISLKGRVRAQNEKNS
jgi:ankyrin repeat protein